MEASAKRMLLGIFLMLLSIWSSIFGVVDQVPLFSVIGVFLPIAAVICFFLGFCAKADGEENQP